VRSAWNLSLVWGRALVTVPILLTLPRPTICGKGRGESIALRVEGLFESSASKPYRLANPLNRLKPNIMQRPVHPDPEVLDSAPLSERWLFSGGSYQAA
jgi:hypothetical protein